MMRKCIVLLCAVVLSPAAFSWSMDFDQGVDLKVMIENIKAGDPARCVDAPSVTNARLSSTLLEYEKAKETVLDVFQANMSEMAEKIREKRPIYEKAGDIEIFSSRNCEPASKLLFEKLKDAGIKTKIVTTPKHVYLEMVVKLGGKETEIIIDSTYRQFYGVYLIKKYGPENYKFSEKDYEGIPLVLFVPRSELKDTLSGFPLRPEWEVKIEYFDFYPSEFKDWYKIGK